jgi:hypothetical protein
MNQIAGSRDVEGCGPQVRNALFSGLMVLGIATATVAVILMWMFLTEPIEVARTVRHGTTGDVARLLATAVYDLVRSMLAWLR